MKRISILLVLISFVLFAYAQEEPEKTKTENKMAQGWSFGLGFGDYGMNSLGGFDLKVGSPIFLDGIRFDVDANYAEYSFMDTATNIHSRYWGAPIMLGYSLLGDFNGIRGGFGGGASMLFGDNKVTDKKLQVGVYIKFFMEFVAKNRVGFFTEAGIQTADWTGINENTKDGFRANKISGSPYYAEGYFATVGVKLYLEKR